MKRIFLITVISVLFCQCGQKQKVTDLMDDYHVQHFFSKEQIKELKNMLVFFEKKLLKNKGDTDVVESYKKLSFELYKAPTGKDQLNVKIMEQVELENYIKNLKQEFFSDIWIFEYGRDFKTRDTLSVTLNYNIDGSYMDLLRSVAKENKDFKIYVDLIDEMGFVCPTSNAYFPVCGLFMDFENPLHRLIYVVHYFTLIYDEAYKKPITVQVD